MTNNDNQEPKLMKISQFRETFFAEGSAPTVKTIKKLILTGELTGKTLGSTQYVVIDEKVTTYDPTVFEEYSEEAIEESFQKLSTKALAIYTDFIKCD
ncbi:MULTISPECIES: hypothetical protein [unclassified Neptuniibacter]|uniref:hypothetical protein n=1 Tax=unclassified Neptuniibacter TaxID=2630693 RepID=UPI0025F7D3FD|nr:MULTISPECIES: hypothetical protein [unclassified Neptuniibacter]|tara:strand:+ start:8709 stop:9002 length:294 start_codon:yes stop_codon:yes gene_type:complete